MTLTKQNTSGQKALTPIYIIVITPKQLKKLYKDPKDYQKKVTARYDELVKAGWALPVYRSMVLAEAAKVSF
jgi:aspartyl/asparaginyl-tRNA synthetase